MFYYHYHYKYYFIIAFFFINIKYLKIYDIKLNFNIFIYEIIFNKNRYISYDDDTINLDFSPLKKIKTLSSL